LQGVVGKKIHFFFDFSLKTGCIPLSTHIPNTLFTKIFGAPSQGEPPAPQPGEKGIKKRPKKPFVFGDLP